MKLNHKQHRRGFTLMELAIVLGVFSAIIASLWTVVNINRQRVRVQQATDAVAYTVDAVRSIYDSQPSITAGIDALVPALTTTQGIPKSFVRSTSATCTNTAGYFADGPWSVTTTDVCGTFRACAWQYKGTGASTTCSKAALTTAQQYFAIEFTQLDFGSCVALASGVYPTRPAGLVDVYVAGTGVIATSTLSLPAPTSWAESNCSTTTTNTVDFVYRLRPPLS